MKPAAEMTHASGDIQRIYRVGNEGFSFVKKRGGFKWSAAPLMFLGPNLTDLVIDRGSRFGRVRDIDEDQIDGIVNAYLTGGGPSKEDKDSSDSNT